MLLVRSDGISVCLGCNSAKKMFEREHRNCRLLCIPYAYCSLLQQIARLKQRPKFHGLHLSIAAYHRVNKQHFQFMLKHMVFSNIMIIRKVWLFVASSVALNDCFESIFWSGMFRHGTANCLPISFEIDLLSPHMLCFALR